MRGTYLAASRLSPFQSTFSYLQTGTLMDLDTRKKFNTSLHDNLEKTKEILILSERMFAQSVRSWIQHTERKGCPQDLNHPRLHLKQ